MRHVGCCVANTRLGQGIDVNRECCGAVLTSCVKFGRQAWLRCREIKMFKCTRFSAVQSRSVVHFLARLLSHIGRHLLLLACDGGIRQSWPCHTETACCRIAHVDCQNFLLIIQRWQIGPDSRQRQFHLGRRAAPSCRLISAWIGDPWPPPLSTPEPWQVNKQMSH